MPKVHPNAVAVGELVAAAAPTPTPQQALRHEQVLTVWNKSLLFNGKGFTVFDSKGNLVFRVDNYASVSKSDVLLMDATGSPLLTIRRKQRLSFGDEWAVFEGEQTINMSPRFVVKKKQMNLMNSKSLVQVMSGEGGGCTSTGSGSSSNTNNKYVKKSVMYEIEGSYSQRCCAVYDEKRSCVAEIKRKEANVGGVSFGVDVFHLVVQPEIDSSVAMALVILLEQMFGSR